MLLPHGQAANSAFLSAFVSLLFIFVWYNSTESMSIVQIFGSGVIRGNGNKDKPPARLPVGQFSIFVPGKFFSYRRPLFITQLLKCRIDDVIIYTQWDIARPHIFACFSLFWSCEINGVLGGSDTCVPHNFMPSNSSLSIDVAYEGR